LIQNKGQVLSRTQLCHRIYGREHTPDQRDIDMLASRLRKHLLDDKEDLNIIKTVRGIGYMFLG
jgi:two-component system OmpR family response regulator